MARRTRKKSSASQPPASVRRLRLKKRQREKAERDNRPEQVNPQVFLPDFPEQVKAIAMQGLTDDEMAAVFGISPALMQSWKLFYPSFAKAVEAGRTQADAAVVQALFKNAVGYDYETDEVVKTRHGGQVITAKRHFPAETTAQKFWLQNRQRDKWNVAIPVALGGRGKENPIHIKDESKQDVINSLLNLITPRPDR